MTFSIRDHLAIGHVIPAVPLALSARRRWDPKHQRAVIRYYLDAGAGGLAVGVHSTQFEIREPKHGLFEPVLQLAAETARLWPRRGKGAVALIAGLCGRTRQATREAQLARGLGYHAGLLSLGTWATATEKEILVHCRTVGAQIPLIGFYLQEAVGGRVFSYGFWREFAEIPELVAIKIAPFNRYRTIDVMRAVAAAGRSDVTLYTGNDDNIIGDLLTPFAFAGGSRHIAGGLLGQWGVWTERAVALLAELKAARSQRRMDRSWWTKNAALTDTNAAIFDSAHGFAGCIPGIHEVLRRQGLLSSTACLDSRLRLSPGQPEEITRVTGAYPWLVDDRFVKRHRDRWLS